MKRGAPNPTAVRVGFVWLTRELKKKTRLEPGRVVSGLVRLLLGFTGFHQVLLSFF